MDQRPADLPPTSVFQQQLSAGMLSFQRCEACSAAIFPPRVLCPACGATTLAWQRSAGIGTIYSSTTMRGRDGAYNIALIDLDDGFRMMSRVAACAPDDVRIGMRVRLRIDREADGAAIAVFVPEIEP